MKDRRKVHLLTERDPGWPAYGCLPTSCNVRSIGEDPTIRFSEDLDEVTCLRCVKAEVRVYGAFLAKAVKRLAVLRRGQMTREGSKAAEDAPPVTGFVEEPDSKRYYPIS